MISKYYIIFLFTVNLFSIYSISAQDERYKFEIIGQEQNLSHNSTTGIIEDSQGFIWISTIDGLNRFDGYKCKVFKHIPNDSTSLSGNRTGALCLDSKGFLWVGTYGFGMNKFNPQTEIFKHYFHSETDSNSISSNFIAATIEDKHGNIWIGTKNGLNLLKSGSKNFIRFFHNPNNSSSICGNEISRLYKDSEDNIWITTIDGGFSKYNEVTNTFTNFVHNPKNPNSIITNNLNGIKEDKSGIFWIGTYQEGLEEFSPITNTFINYKYFPGEKNGISNNIVYSIYIDSFNNIWTATRNGLSILIRATGQFTNYKSFPNIKNSISSNNIDKFFEDSGGNLWITTYGGGVNRLINFQKRFNVFRNLPNNKNSLSNNFISAIVSGKKIIYVGTVGGLNIFDRNKKKWKLLSHIPNSKNSISRNEIGALLLSTSTKLWVGTRGSGIDVFNTDNWKKLITFNSSNKLPGDDIIRLYKDKIGRIWILTSESGFCYFNLNTKNFKYFDPKNYSNKYPRLPRAILVDKQKRLWIGTYKKGLYLYDAQQKFIRKFVSETNNPNSLGNNTIWDIFEDNAGKIWTCTDGGGINLYNNLHKNFIRYTIKNGLPNNVVYAVEEDDNNLLWISTNDGIARFDPVKKEFKNFTTADGLQGSEFNSGASYKNNNGELFFGGVNGFNYFNPATLKLNNQPPKIVFTSFKIENKEANFDTSITYIKNIKLSYNDRVFTIEFTELNFNNTKRNQYSYMFEGFSNKWTYSGKKRTATYTNLNPGKYIFKVKAANGDGYWSKQPASLSIIITPPFWDEWWFLTIVVLVLLSAIIGTVRYFATKELRKQVIVLEKEKAVQQERERISRDLHDNIGSQLTFLISSLDNLLYSKKKIDIKNRLGKLGKFSRQTLNELRNTIWAMKHEEINLKEFILKIEELKMNLKETVDSIEINLINLTNKIVRLNSVQNLNLYRIIEESLQNTIKHSHASNFTIKFTGIPIGFALILKDNGIGFNHKQLLHRRGLDNMKFRCEEAGGRFSFKSDKNGTEITCRFQLNNTNAV